MSPQGAIHFDLLLRMALALSIGLIVGVERGWQRRDDPGGGRTAGVRTFALVGLFGGLAGLLSQSSGSPTPWLVCLALLTAVFGVFSYREGGADKDFSVTNVVTAMTVFALSVLAITGNVQIAAAGGVTTAALLASREHLHRAVARLSWEELRSGLLLLAMTAVVLPILPNRPIDPLGAVNPREIWLLMILTGAVSFVGYIAMKIGGPEKGPPVAGLAGGLASSTAATLAMSRLSRAVRNPAGLVAGTAFASMVSLIRATFLAMVLQPALGPLLIVPAGAAAAVFGVGGLLGIRGDAADADAPANPGPPFDVATVFGFGLLLAVVMLAGAWIAQRVGSAGVYAFATASGLVDVDAITLANARAVERGQPLAMSAAAILLAMSANAVLRLALGHIYGSRGFALRFSVVSGLALAAGVLAFVVLQAA